jgi:tetratricopeptide (TPR) repeat protein
MLLCMRILLLACMLWLSIPCAAQTGNDWGKLLDAKKIKEAEALCTSWTASPQLSKRVEAEKCLANVELCKGSQLHLMGNDTGGGSLGEGYTPEAAKAALIHLNKGIQLAPQDLSIHQGRLYVLESAGMFDAMDKALEDSIGIYKGADALQAWLAFDAELGDMGQARAGLSFAEVLNRHYPNSHDVLGNIGAFHNMLGEHEQALPFEQRAAKLAPSDPMDVWNLGWTYNYLGNTAEADTWMSKSIALDPSGKQLPDSKCLYAEFVETKLHQTERACKLEKASCPPDRQKACTNDHAAAPSK